MARGLFGRRKGAQTFEASDRAQLPSAPERSHEAALGLPALAYIMSGLSGSPDAPAESPKAELLEGIAGLRGAVADRLYEMSKDYRILCDMTHAELEACDEIITELRRRLAGDVHYAVLAKLDEALALVDANAGRETSPGDDT